MSVWHTALQMTQSTTKDTDKLRYSTVHDIVKMTHCTVHAIWHALLLTAVSMLCVAVTVPNSGERAEGRGGWEAEADPGPHIRHWEHPVREVCILLQDKVEYFVWESLVLGWRNIWNWNSLKKWKKIEWEQWLHCPHYVMRLGWTVKTRDCSDLKIWKKKKGGGGTSM